MLLVILGEKLECLSIDGRTGLLHDFKFSFLWIVPNLELLHLDNVAHLIDLEDFGKGIACLRHLEEFFISGQESQDSVGFTSFPIALCSLEHLTALSFENQDLGRLPEDISQLTKLAYLSIQGGSVEHSEEGHLPAILGHLTALESLTLSSCLRVVQAESGSLPETSCWRCMTQLTRLEMTGGYGGPEVELPPEVGFLTGLIELELLHSNQLEDQLQLSALRSLESIRISFSFRMARVPAWMGVLPKLTFLEIVAVELEAWPSAGFTSLQSLGMLTCGVEKVSDSVGQLTRLTALDLLDCPLTELSSGISCLQNLRHLNIDTTHFLEFPCALQALRAPQLQRVCLESTGLARMRGRKGRPMPVNAWNLAWLLHHPRLEGVSISASEADAAALQGFKKELSRVCGRDVLTIQCYK